MSAMLIRATTGYTYEKRTKLMTGAWPDYCKMWAECATIERRPEDKEPCTPFVSPFLLRDHDAGKTKVNTTGCGAFFGGDVDIGWTFERLVERFSGIPHFIHTTTKNRWAAPRLRVLFETSRELSGEAEYQSLWHFTNAILDGCVDPNTKNINRLLYVPARWIGADNAFSYQVDGEPLDVDEVMAWSPPIDVEPRLQPVAAINAGRPHHQGSLITPRMEETFRSASEGGRFYHLLLCMACRAKRNGWCITASGLAREALAFDRLVTRKHRKQPEREAARALAFADTHVATFTDLDRLRARLDWQFTRQLLRKEANGKSV